MGELTSNAPPLGKEMQAAVDIMKPYITLRNNMLEITQCCQAVICREGSDRAASRQHARLSGEVGVEVGGGVGDDADGEVDASDGFQYLDVGSGCVDVGGIYGAEI